MKEETFWDKVVEKIPSLIFPMLIVFFLLYLWWGIKQPPVKMSPEEEREYYSDRGPQGNSKFGQ